MALTKVKAGNILLTTPGASSNDVTPATTAYVTTALANLADSAPSTLDTLNELAAALGDDANFSTTVTNSIAAKLPLAGGTMTGNLLIGTTDAGYPAYGDELTIGSASGNNGMTIRSGTSNYGTFYFSDATGNGAGTYAGKLQYNHSNNSMVLATNSLDRLTIDSSGTIFHKTTSPTLHSAVTGIVFENGSLLNDVTRGDGKSITLAQNLAIDSGNTWAYLAAGEGSYYQQFNGNHYFGTAASGSAGADATVNTKMLINSAGNVIIGGTAALGGAKLSIDHSGAAIIGADTSSSGGGYIQLLASDSSKGLLGFGSNSGASSINNVALRSQSGDIEFHTGGANERMRIDSNGDVFIGQTSQTGYAFAQKLVVGDGDNNDGITIQSGATHQGNLAFNHSDGTTAHGRISYQHQTNYMQFFVNNSEKMRISSSGLVEIGQSYTANANASVLRLSGMSTSAYSGGLEWYSGYGPKTTAAMYSTASGSAGGEWWLQVKRQGTSTLVTALSINNAGAVLAGGSSSGGYVLNAQTSYGNWGVGANNAAYCHYNTDRGMYYFNTACYASGGFHTYSDSRLKENVTAVTGALDKVALMNGVTFNWKNPETRGGTGKQFGVLAQNMLEVDSELPTLNDDPLSPEETRETDDSYYTMDYTRITPFLIESIKELKTKLEAAEARIATLEE